MLVPISLTYVLWIFAMLFFIDFLKLCFKLQLKLWFESWNRFGRNLPALPHEGPYSIISSEKRFPRGCLKVHSLVSAEATSLCRQTNYLNYLKELLEKFSWIPGIIWARVNSLPLPPHSFHRQFCFTFLLFWRKMNFHFSFCCFKNRLPIPRLVDAFLVKV